MMECNKDEATRAKVIAETKFTTKDIAGAKKFALKARDLFPALDGIQQMISTLDVYVSAENKTNGEADWYGILNVNPQADDDTVRKHYRKLALMLHPDKNKSIGAEGAFKLISEAWNLLSDKAKRAAYDQKRNSSRSGGGGGGPSNSKGVYGFQNFTKKSTTTHKCTTTRMGPSTSSSQKPKPNTFWTVCHGCKMQYEYLRVYLNHNLLCPNCQEPFLAVETAPPPMSSSTSSKSSPISWDFSNNNQTGRKNSKSGSGWAPFSGTTSGAATTVQAANMVQQAYQKVKREREEAQAATKREEALKKKSYYKRKKAMDGHGATAATNNQMGIRAAMTRSLPQGNFETNGVNIPKSTSNSVPYLGIQDLLMKMAKVEIQNKLNEWKNVDEKKNEKTIKKEKEPSVNGSSVNIMIQDHAKPVKTMSINVPDPDFHDFDKDRTEKSFEDNQVWSAYDDDDGMPRYYAFIHKVISQDPFTMRISWLNSKTNTELGPLNWVGSGFAKTCGDFRIGKYEINNSLNSFSHKVRYTKGTRGAICIFPRKGEVWALYRNWSHEWNELTTDEVIHRYDMVEVIDDYNETEGGGVIVTPLVKVAGFKTVFHRHLDLGEVRRIPKEEMFRFSHHVPSYLLTGHEATNAPKGCRELDPAATPFELLQVVITDDDEDNTTVDVTEKTTKMIDDTYQEFREEEGEDKEEIKENISINQVVEMKKKAKENNVDLVEERAFG